MEPAYEVTSGEEQVSMYHHGIDGRWPLTAEHSPEAIQVLGTQIVLNLMETCPHQADFISAHDPEDDEHPRDKDQVTALRVAHGGSTILTES